MSMGWVAPTSGRLLWHIQGGSFFVIFADCLLPLAPQKRLCRGPGATATVPSPASSQARVGIKFWTWAGMRMRLWSAKKGASRP